MSSKASDSSRQGRPAFPHIGSSHDEIEAALKRMSKQAIQYEDQMKDLEAKLSENLSNFRVLDGLLQEAFANFQTNTARAERAKTFHVPQIQRDLDHSKTDLFTLSKKLPTIQEQLVNIRRAYDSGRDKAQALVSDLEWLNTDFHERWRTIIFTSSSPVSLRWKVIMRFLFTISFVFCVWLAWIAIWGAWRAHRQRLVWGERLMS